MASTACSARLAIGQPYCVGKRPRASILPIRRSRGSASAGQLDTSAGHQANSSCSSSGTGSASEATRREADQHRQAAGQPDERLDPQPLGLEPPLLAQLARERGHRALSEFHRAAGTKRPAVGPGGHPRGAAPGEPTSVRRAHDAQRGERVARRAVQEAQRPARRLELQLEVVARLAVARQARGQAVVRGRAALAQGVDLGVGLGAQLRRGLEVVVAPENLDPVRTPRTARQQPGKDGHQLSEGSSGIVASSV